MSDPITQEQMERLFSRFFGDAAVNPAERAATESIEEFTKRIKESTKSMKSSISVSQTIMGIADGQKTGMVDVTESMKKLDEEIEELNKSIGTASDNTGVADKKNKIAAIQGAKIEIAKSAAIKNATSAVANFALATINTVFSLAMASMDFTTALIGSSSSVAVAAQAMSALTKAQGEAAVAAAELTRGMGSAVSALSGLPGIAGVAAAVIGTGMQMFGAVAADAAKKLTEAKQKEITQNQTALEQQIKSYMDITAAGIILAGGMTQMRRDASRAGLGVDQFAKVLKDSKEDLVFLGLGFGQASSKLSKVGAAIKNAGVDTELLKLGYAVEEQASLAVSLMANQKAAGDYRARTDAEVAAETLAYGKSLKILSDITGKDAKKAAEKARTESMRLEVSSKLTVAQNERFQAALTNMPEDLKKGFIEKILTGGTVLDQATNILISNNQQAGAYLENQMDMVLNSSKTVKQVSDDTLIANAVLGQSLRTMDSTINTVGALVPGVARDVGEMANKLILATNYNVEAVKTAIAGADASATNRAELDKNVATLTLGVQALKTSLQVELTGAITTFATAALASAADLYKIAGVTREVTTGLWDKVTRVGKVALTQAAVGAGAGAVAGGSIGLAAGGVTAAPGAVIGAGAGALTFGLYAAIKELFFNKEGLAVGGVAEGPKSGYLEKLHGTEAVVPLEGGRTIPVSLNMSNISSMINDIINSKSGQSGATAMGPIGGLVSAGMSMLTGRNKKDPSDLMQEQIDLMKQFIDTTTQQLSYLRESKDLQQQLVYNSH